MTLENKINVMLTFSLLLFTFPVMETVNFIIVFVCINDLSWNIQPNKKNQHANEL